MAQVTSTQRKASGKTGTVCQESGPYRSMRYARVIVFIKKGQLFPTDSDGSATTWTLVSAAEEPSA